MELMPSRAELSSGSALRALCYRERPCDTLLLVLCGLPGAGKTTLAKAIVQHFLDANTVLESLAVFKRVTHVEYDALEQDDDYGMIRAKAEAKINAELTQGGLVICDDNQYYKSMRKPFLRMAQSQGVGHLLVYVTVPVEVALKRNRTRTSNKVPEEVIFRMCDRFEAPEGDHLSIDGTARLARSVKAVVTACLQRKVEVPLITSKVAALPLSAKALSELERRKQVRAAILEAKQRGATPEEMAALAKTN